MSVKPYTLFTGDNLPILRGMDTESVDLIYLDPPFNKNKDFKAPIGSEAAGAAFKDWWTLDDIKEEEVGEIAKENQALSDLIQSIGSVNGKSHEAYLIVMAIRLLEMKRILKPTGSIYLHCDPTMSHSLKLVMDAIFGRSSFRNEIVWQRATSTQKGSQHKNKKWGNNADILLFFAKSPKAPLNPLRKLTEDEIQKKFNKTDENGRRYYDDSAHIWSTPGMGDRPNLCYEWRGFRNPHPSGWRLSKERLEEEYQKGNIVITDEGKLERRKYEEDYKGATFGNVWTNINPAQGEQRTGYPTQKPLALLERIILASSNRGDIVLDPFCGCATTPIAAMRIAREWIGIDLSEKAVELVKSRMKKEGLLGYKFYHRTDVPTRSDKVKRSRDIKTIRYGEQRGNCKMCGYHFPYNNMTVDHITPRAKGGTDDDDNLQLLCGRCNSIKGGNRTMAEARARYREMEGN
ncbi:MAG: DNA methyltransferase [Candidatus Dadabacteria bacterium]|nr:DNA methyltransferase [Candidatus Dadabacteria bacterium]